MHKLYMALHANDVSNSAVSIVTAGAGDTLSAVAPLNRWGINISPDGSSYYLNHVGVGNLGLRAANGAASPGLGVTIGAPNELLSVFRWLLIEVENPPLGVFIYNTQSEVFYSETITISIFNNVPQSISDHNLAAVAYSVLNTNPAISWHSSNPNVVSVNSETGEFIGRSSGTATLTVSISGETASQEVCIIVRVKSAYSLGGEFHDGNDVISAAQNWEDCGYSSTYTISPSIVSLEEEKLNTEILYFSTHGNQHYITFENDMLLYDEISFETNTIRSIEGKTLDYTKLCIYDACLTASNLDGTGENLCTATIAAGADCVIGWTEKIIINDARNWQEHFQNYLSEGFSVAEAANLSNAHLYWDNSIKSWRIYGNKDLVIVDKLATPAKSDMAYVEIATSGNAGTKYSEENAIQLLRYYFEDVDIASSDRYEVTKTYTSDDMKDYVVDYVVYRGEYSLNAGFSIIVENEEIIGVQNNMDAYSTAELSICTNAVTNIEEIRMSAYEEAAQQVYDMSTEYSIISQTDELFFDCTTSTRYCRVFTEYCTETGAYGAFAIECSLDEEATYER